MNSTENNVKKILYSLGADVCGIGSIERFSQAPEGFAPTDIYAGCKSVICFGLALPKGLWQVNPRLVYGYFNGEICKKVDEIALKAAKEIEKNDKAICVPIPCDAPNEYWDAENMTAKGLISMKHTAVACGLGQLGKSSIFLNEQFGNRLTIGAILTNLPLSSDPYSESICIPECHLCEDSCPVQAIHDGCVSQKKCRTNTYGKTARGFDTVDCNRCRSVCPMKYGKLHNCHG